MYTNDIHRLVDELKEKFHTDNPFEIADISGITIIYKPFKKLKGMYLVSGRCAFIYLCDNLDEFMSNIIVFHELGHHFLHKHLAVSSFQECSLYDMKSKPEMEANIFAANYMISDQDVFSYAQKGFTTEQTAHSLCVPHEMLLIKLKDMDSRGYNLKLDYIPRADFLGR